MPAKFQVEIARSAEEDLEQIWSFITADNPAAADRFILDLERKVSTLEHFPKRCPLIPENELLKSQYRHLILDRYRIVFRISEKQVFVLRILHGSRLLDPSVLESIP